MHSTFSDGGDTLEANVAPAEELGLTALGCVDHVRVDSARVPSFQSALAATNGVAATTIEAGPTTSRAWRSSSSPDEAAVIERTSETLARLDHPAERLRVYVVRRREHGRHAL